MKKLLLLLILFTNMAHAAHITIPFHNALFDTDCCLVIAHAGGGIQGFTHTNSKEAMDAHYALGRRVFELDFEKTSDGHWVAVRRWKDWAESVNIEKEVSTFDRWWAYIKDEPVQPKQTDFRRALIHRQFTALTLNDLAEWFQAHPDAMLIIDTKNNLSSLFSALNQYPMLQHHLVYQAYEQADLNFLKTQQIEPQRVIFTNYQHLLSDDKLIAMANELHVGAITIPMDQALRSSAKLRAALPNTPIYVHGKPESINTLEVQYRLQQAGVSGFYLD